jgi:hypothetical protein
MPQGLAYSLGVVLGCLIAYTAVAAYANANATASDHGEDTARQRAAHLLLPAMPGNLLMIWLKEISNRLGTTWIIRADSRKCAPSFSSPSPGLYLV